MDVEKAKKINPRVNRAIEYKDAYGFENTKAGMQFGGKYMAFFLNCKVF